MSDLWFLSHEGQGFGPFSNDQLRQLVQAGLVGGSDLVWQQGARESLPASSVLVEPPPLPTLATKAVVNERRTRPQTQLPEKPKVESPSPKRRPPTPLPSMASPPVTSPRRSLAWLAVVTALLLMTAVAGWAVLDGRWISSSDNSTADTGVHEPGEGNKLSDPQVGQPQSNNASVAVNDKSSAEFPTQVEERQPGKMPLAFTTPEMNKWAKDVAELAANQQVAVVAKKLQEMNAGFDGKETHTIKDGVVTELTFVTDNVIDISPVRALSGLKTLHCSGSGVGRGKLAELTPLKGMRLTRLQCYCNPIKDLSPLSGMLLNHLTCSYSPVSDITPLKEMPLSSLNLGRTSVSDLSPLRGCPLVELNIADTPVSSISPLKGMPLRQLYCNETKISDLSPLIGSPLSTLNVSQSPVSTFSALRNLPLTYLKLDFKPGRDADILRSIKTLQIINDKPSTEFWKEVEDKNL